MHRKARTTADLIASVPGAAPAGAIRVIQFVAYVLIGAFTAASIAAMALLWIRGPTWWFPAGRDPRCPSPPSRWAPSWWGALPTRSWPRWRRCWRGSARRCSPTSALAVIAGWRRAPRLSTRHRTRPDPRADRVGPCGTFDFARDRFAVFEIPTTVNARLYFCGPGRSGSRWPSSSLCAAVAWVATNMGSTGEFRYNAADLFQVAARCSAIVASGCYSPPRWRRRSPPCSCWSGARPASVRPTPAARYRRWGDRGGRDGTVVAT